MIVGGGLAGARTAEQLRKSGYQAPIVIVGEESHLPYDRPPLSKEVLSDPARGLSDVLLRPVEFYEENDIAVVLGVAAESLDPAARTVALADGTVLDYDEVVIDGETKKVRIVFSPETYEEVIEIVDETEDDAKAKEMPAPPDGLVT